MTNSLAAQPTKVLDRDQARRRFIRRYCEYMLQGLPKNDPHYESEIDRLSAKFPKEPSLGSTTIRYAFATKEPDIQARVLKFMFPTEEELLQMPSGFVSSCKAIIDGTHVYVGGTLVPVDTAAAIHALTEIQPMQGLGKSEVMLPVVEKVADQVTLEVPIRLAPPSEAQNFLKTAEPPASPVLPPNPAFCIVQDWVLKLPGRAQGTLVVATRGCDLMPKHPLDSPGRTITAQLRGVILNHVDPREIDSEPGCFMQSTPPKLKLSALEHFPLHWVSHVMHAAEVIGHMHPDPAIAFPWMELYKGFCHSLHVNPETKEQMLTRLCEDRIQKGNIVG